MSNNISLQENADKMIDLYFKQPNILYEHLFTSFHQLIEEIIPYCLIQESNYFYQSVSKNNIYFHGFKCSNIRIKPPIFDNDNEIKFPNDSRKNHLNYFATVIGDVVQVLEKIDIITGDKIIKEIGNVEKDTSIANIPVMVKSKYCSTSIKKDLHGECRYDPGGYFIVNGQEKVVMSIEKMVDNKTLVFTKKEPTFLSGFMYVAQINSRKNEWTDNLQIITIKNKKENNITVTSSSLVDVPLFILFRAFGIESDKDIISRITYDLNDIKMINLLRASMDKSVDDNGNSIKTKDEAIEYLSNKLRKNKMISQSDEALAKIQKKMMLEKIFRQDFLPHLGEDIPKKIAFLGHMVNKLLNVWLERVEPDDRDVLQNKRIETPGILIGQLFRQNWNKMLKEIGKLFAKKNQTDEAPINVINQLKPSTIEQGIKTALATGIWGINKSKKGVAQALQRLSWIQAISCLRRVMSPSLDSSTTKVTSIRQAQNLQAQFLCICETPEGQKIGIVKSLAMMSTITTQNSSQHEVITSILKNSKIKHPADIDPLDMKLYIKIFINGEWFGVSKLENGQAISDLLKKSRRSGIIDKYTTICLDYNKKEIKVFYDGGRLIRPVLIVTNNKIGLTEELVKDLNIETEAKDTNKSWKRLISKYQNVVDYEDVESSNYIMCADKISRLNETEDNRERVVEYSESNKINRYGDYRWVKYTHCDFHAWTQLGIIAGNIPFSNHNHAGRNIIHFSQAKQAISVYLTSYKDRMDISQVLHYPQVPIVTTKTMEYNNCLDLPYGENAIVAILSYNGYNQEDSMIFNQSALDRGFFRADTLKKYHSEIDKNPSTNQDDIFTKPDKNKVADIKQGNYSKLSDKGFVPEETKIQNEDFIIGKVSPIQPTGENNKVYKDSSEIFKSNVDGVIDRVHTGIYNVDGYEMYNVRVRMERFPVIGDKFCLTESHEVMTTEGWKYINNITLKDMVACLNENGEIYYSNPLKLWEFEHKGQMYKLESQQVDLITTLNHKMYVKKQDHTNFELVEAKDIMGKRINYKKNGMWIKENQETFQINNTILNMNDWLYFLGIWFAEGWTDTHSKRITISTNKKQVQNKLDEVCKNMNLHIIRSDNYKWHIHNIEIFNYLTPYSVDNVNKQLPEWVFNLNESQSRILLEALLLDDDHITKSNCYKYFTSSKKLADNISRLALHCGWSANTYVREYQETTTEPYIITIVKNNNEPTINHGQTETQNGEKESLIDYDGMVYCIEVPSHIFYTRLNGKPVWTGNSNRHGQKGTLGIALQQKDMPFTSEGIIPDIIMNPHALPSRMTIGQLIECLASKVGAIEGTFIDGTPYCDYDVRKLPETLEKLGYNKYGNETLYCGMTGRKMDSEIFMGPTYQVRLKHMTSDKYHSRSRGPRQALTRQPLEGRSRDGGLKIGEMEKDAMIAHGMAQFIKERMMETSDITKVYICDDCGLFASKVIDKDYYYCKACHNSNRISAVVMPYAAKLLFQELMSVNILPRIRTERSIYSDET